MPSCQPQYVPLNFLATSDSGRLIKPSSIHRSEKDIRHCDAEKARRDHQSTYIDMGFSLRHKFQWPEEATATALPLTAEDQPKSLPTPNSSFSSSNADGISSDALTENKKLCKKDAPKLTKQTKLHQQVLWEFRACLRIDVDRVREWLDEIREQGEELRRRKRDCAAAQGSAKGLRCSKDDALLEMWRVMEREWREFVAGKGEVGAVPASVGRKRRRSTDEIGRALVATRRHYGVAISHLVD